MSTFKQIKMKGMDQCPYCNSYNIIIVVEIFEDGTQLHNCTCKNCHEFWKGQSNVKTGGYEKHLTGIVL